MRLCDGGGGVERRDGEDGRRVGRKKQRMSEQETKTATTAPGPENHHREKENYKLRSDHNFHVHTSYVQKMSGQDGRGQSHRSAYVLSVASILVQRGLQTVHWQTQTDRQADRQADRQTDQQHDPMRYATESNC